MSFTCRHSLTHAHKSHLHIFIFKCCTIEEFFFSLPFSRLFMQNNNKIEFRSIIFFCTILFCRSYVNCHVTEFRFYLFLFFGTWKFLRQLKKICFWNLRRKIFQWICEVVGKFDEIKFNNLNRFKKRFESLT